jgi:hypothetical protein
MRRCLLCLWLVGCATAPAVPPPSAVEGVLAEPPAPPLVAQGEVVFQAPHDSPIRTLLAEPGWAHFITESGGVVAVHDLATGAVRAWRRPWPRADVAIAHDASGTLLMLTPMSSYEHTAFLWSLQDDRMYLVRGGNDQDHPGDEPRLVVGGQEGAYTLSLEEGGTRRVLATRSYVGYPRAEFSLDRQTVVLAEVAPGGGRADVSLLDAETLDPRARLGTTTLPSVLRRSNALLLSTVDGIELRSTRDGSRLGLIPPDEHHGVSIGSPDEAYDGSCLSMPISETYRVRLYRATDLTFVHEADTRGFGTYAVLPGCAGVVGQSPESELRSFGPGLPSEGALFGTAGTLRHLFEGEFIRPVSLVGPDSAITANGISVAWVARGSTPRFVIAPTDVVRAPSPWAYGFLTSGAVFVMGRGFVHTVGSSGLAPAVCEGPADVMVSPSGTTSLGTRSTFCDLERQRSERWEVRSETQAGRFVIVQDQSSVVRVLDIEQGTTTPIAAGVAPYRSPVAISENGRVVAYAHSSGTSVRLIEGAERASTATPLVLRHRATRHTLYDTMLAVESEGRITLYAFDGSVPVDQEVVPTRYVPPTPTRSVFLISDGTHTDVIEARTGATLAAFDGAPVPEMYEGDLFTPDPRLPLPVIRHGDATAFVRVVDGQASLLPLGNARVLGSDPLERFLAVCRAGALTVLAVATQESRAFGTCLDSDRVRVRGDGDALLMVRGVQLTLRTPRGETVLNLLDRGGVPLLFLSNTAGAYTGSAELVPRFRFRRAGPLLSAPLEPLTAGLESPALLREFSLTP